MSRCLSPVVFSGLLLLGCLQPLLAQTPNIPRGTRGVTPLGDDGRPRNLDLEAGSLQGWTADGPAFEQQPIRGEIDENRGPGSGKKSEHTGEFWIGGYERLGDEPQGTLVSDPFEVTHPFASFLIGGGNHRETRVELVRADNQEVVFAVSGENRENLRPVIVNTEPFMGQRIFIRLIDQHSGGWGHVNFDDFRFHDREPVFPNPREVIRPAPAIEQLYPHEGLSAEQAVRAMRLPPGFKVQVGASEPDVQQPIALAIDDRGRIWVAEAYEYPLRAPEGEGRDRILIFEDTNGDGSLDQRKVFAENLNLVSGLEVGFGGVWVGAAPYLLFIPDADGDDRPDAVPQVLLDGWGYEDTHETLNAFIWGPDGWLYGCHGVFTHSRVGKPGTPDEQRVPINAGIWRYHPVRHTFEVFAHGTSNPWGVDFDDFGQAFCTACVIPHLYHVIPGARYQRQAGEHFNKFTYDDITTIALHRHYVGNQWNNTDRRRSDELGGGHAHAGAMVYLGGTWPDEFRNKIFMSNIHGNRINVDVLQPYGSGYLGDRQPDFLLTGDQWSQMLNLRYGPDGQVWLIDWYDANQCHHRDEQLHDRSNGRIYRIVYEEGERRRAVADVDLAASSDPELVELQTHDNDWFVRHARRILQERASTGGIQPEAQQRLRELATTHPDATRRLRGLWAIHVTSGVGEELATDLLKDESPYVRAWIVRLMAEQGAGEAPSWQQVLVRLAHEDPSPVVRLQIASAVQGMPLASRWNILDGLTSHAEDASDHNLPLMYWYAAEPLAELDDRRALAWALVAGTKIPLLSQYMVRRIGSTDVQRSLALLVEGLRGTDDAQMQLTFLRGLNEALRGRRQVKPPADWPEAYQHVMQGADEALHLEALTLARTFGDAQAGAALRQIAFDRQQDISARKAALAALLKAQDEGLVQPLQDIVASDDTALQGDALRALAAFDAPSTPQVILAAYDRLALQEQRDALSTLSSRRAYADELLSAVAKGTVSAQDLTADIVRQLRNLGDEKINSRIREVWGTVRDTAEDKAKLIAQHKQLIENSASPGDVQRGRALFAKTCQQCHVLYGVGGSVGPDLTGSNRNNLDYLLSNVLDPSAVMAKEYQPSVIITASGRVLTGIVRSAGEEAVAVQMANETVILPKDEIEEMQLSPTSMMPENLLSQLSEDEVRSLVAYLATEGQTPMLATAENASSFFNGKDLSGWRGNEKLWSVEGGEIVGRSPGIPRNEFLVSELAVEDFELKLQVKLEPNKENSGIQFRSELRPDGLVRGYQADIGEGWWGKLYEEHGRALLWDKPADQHVKPGEWNNYRIVAEGSRIRTYLNGNLCVDLDDPQGARRGIIALQIHSGGPLEVRFRNLELNVK